VKGASLAQMATKVKRLEARRKVRKVRIDKTNTAVGIVCPNEGLLYAIKRDDDGHWQYVDEEPQVYLPLAMDRAIRSTKRFIVIIGGRGSAKSVSVADMCLIDAYDNRSKTYCLREYQSSIKNSVHSLLSEEITRLEFNNFNTKNAAISHNGVELFQFAGLARNTDSIKSAHGFKRYWVEEAQFMSASSLRALTPTVRKKPKKGLPGQQEEIAEPDPLDSVSIVFVANPGSSEDPFSKRFIEPFKGALDAQGYYEDDLHLIIVMNYHDNPWYQDSGLEEERQWDFENLERALYDHTWLGGYNDSVENALILSEWFDACIDAHVKLNFEPRGVRKAAHDPSDGGQDTKGYAAAHGSVVYDIQEKEDGNVNDGAHWAANIAIEQQVDYFTWDGDGMGLGLGEQIAADFGGKHVKIRMFRGSEGPDFPNAIYRPAKAADVLDQKTIKDTFKNKRAQYYYELRDRIYRTYRAVVFGEYADPDTLISFSSDIPLLKKLRAELCRMPRKPNLTGLLELYTKEDMKRLFKIASPNLGDSVMMLMRYIPQNTRNTTVIPQTLRPYRPSVRRGK
jgi:phage terminase large subunit